MDEASWRQDLLATALHRFGSEEAERLATRLAGASPKELHAWCRRIAFMPNLDQVLDLNQPLPVRIVLLGGLVRCAMAAPLRSWGILLRLKGSTTPCETEPSITEAVPWFVDLPDREIAASLLLGNKWLLVLCDDREPADLLLSMLQKPSRVEGTLIHPDGRGSRVLNSSW